jgi:hypothetical protein
MALEEGTRNIKEWRGDYDFSVDGGVQGTLTLRSPDGPIPSGSYIIGGMLEVATILGSGGSSTAAVQAVAANDVVTATAFGSSPWSSTGRKSVTPAFTGATSLKTTQATNPALVIATADLNAGKFTVILYFR